MARNFQCWLNETFLKPFAENDLTVSHSGLGWKVWMTSVQCKCINHVIASLNNCSSQNVKTSFHTRIVNAREYDGMVVKWFMMIKTNKQYQIPNNICIFILIPAVAQKQTKMTKSFWRISRQRWFIAFAIHSCSVNVVRSLFVVTSKYRHMRNWNEMKMHRLLQ